MATATTTPTRTHTRAPARPKKPVQILAEAGRAGALIALSRSTPGTYYRLTADAYGRWACTCALFGFKGDCSHVKAASEHVRATRTTRTTHVKGGHEHGH